MLLTQAQSVKADVGQARAAALEIHRRGEGPFQVVEAFTAGVDAIILRLFDECLRAEADRIALVAVGGYGRKELCPQSDIDILFVCESNAAVKEGTPGAAGITKLVQLLWDAGFVVGNAVRTPVECYAYMRTDLTTANTMLESRYLGGSERLYSRFIARARNRYRRRKRELFVRGKLEMLMASVDDPSRTIYVMEPNVKEGACGLRDIQRVLWIENMTEQGPPFHSLLTLGRFLPAEVKSLREAYEFYLRLRCELHFTNDVRQDILERDSVHVIARNLGYGPEGDDRAAVEALMGDYYRHARDAYRFLRLYLQTETRGRSLLARVERWLRSKNVRSHLSLYKGRLYLKAPPEGGVTPERILEIFHVAQEKDARVSEILCDWIRGQLESMEPDFTHLSEVLRGFRAFLRGPHVGRILKTMHATGFLERILPEFGRLNCLVNFDGHHQFTVDEHTLKTLEEIDKIEMDPAYAEPEFRRIYLEVKDHLPLRLALLLHDMGKAIPGEHSVSGTRAATLICERLGLDEKVVEVVDFLVYRHLELFRVSEHRDFEDESVIEGLAALVMTEERLRMLYLLTYIDIVSVGPGTWTRWKGAQLSEVYQRTLIHLRTGMAPIESLDVMLETAQLAAEDRRAIKEHCSLMETPGYAREILPEQMLAHLKLVEQFQARKEVQLALEKALNCHEVTFCGGDRPGLFADFAGLLYSEGLNVLGARIYSRSDGVIIDLFQVEIADTVTLSVEDRVERVRKKLRKIETQKDTVAGFLRQRARSHKAKRWRRPLFGPSIAFDNETSESCSLIEVSAGDRPGLLYDLARALHRLGLDVRTAKVSTLTDRAHDVFYVVERDGKKIDGAPRRGEIAQLLSAQAQDPAAEISGTT